MRPKDPAFMTRDAPERLEQTLCRASDTLAGEMGKPLAAGLYVVATPIGNLADITLRAISTLARADIICCEDTRHSRKLLGALSIRARLLTYNDQSGEAERARILRHLGDGLAVALISDAGTPLISDPGYKLVAAAHANGYAVFTVPGPSALTAALSVGGQPTDTFLFDGFLPAKAAARRRRLQELAGVQATLVFYESAQRLAETLADAAAAFPGRQATVCREMTKFHEQRLSGSLEELAAAARSQPLRGEIVIVIAPPTDVAQQPVEDDEIVAALGREMASGSVRDAIDAVAEMYNIKRRRVYELAHMLKPVNRKLGRHHDETPSTKKT
mgnify:CR=1 FL=1